MYKTTDLKTVTIKYIIIILTACVIICFSKELSQGIFKSLCLCSEVLIPSLFPFMILATFIGKSNLSNYGSKALNVPTQLIFGVDGSCAITIILSLIGGYPVGAKGIRTLYENKVIDINTAKKLSYSLVCSGPGFLVVYVGQNLLNSKEIGLCLFASQIISVIILGILNKYILKKDKCYNSNLENKNALSTTDALIEAVKSSTYTMLEMCGMVITFDAVITILQKFPSIYTYIAIVLEVTFSSKILTESGKILPLAFAVGFGGLCVHFQVFQILKDIKIKKWLFFLYRIMQGLLTLLFTYIFIKIFNIAIPVYSSTTNAQFALSSTSIGSVMLLLTGISFLYTFKKQKE